MASILMKGWSDKTYSKKEDLGFDLNRPSRDDRGICCFYFQMLQWRSFFFSFVYGIHSSIYFPCQYWCFFVKCIYFQQGKEENR